MLRYKVLDNGTGVLLTRTPHGLGETVRFCIADWQEGDRLVLTRADEKTIYRTLREGCCTVPSALLYGTVTVTLLRQSRAPISCEPIFCEDVDGVRILAPADMDLPGRVVQLEVQTDDLPALRRQIVAQEKKLVRLHGALTAVIEWIRTQEEKGELPI